MATISLAQSLSRLVAGNTVFVPGASGAPDAWMNAFLADPVASRGVTLTTTYAPGINPLAPDRLHPEARLMTLFMQPSLSAAQASGICRHLPLSYAGFLRHLADQPPFDVAVVQISPPNARGRCSFGPSVEFAALVLPRARRRVGIINARTPWLPGAPDIAPEDFTELVETDTALPTYALGDADAVATSIATHLAPFIRDGATLQTGLGRIPGAILEALAGHRGLKFHSGMLSDGLMHLHEAGALDADHAHLACALVGSAHFYDWAKDAPRIRIRGCDITHDPRLLASLDRFVAINSAITVDLFGQANLERLKGRAISGAGGAPDFASAAKRSAGGLSIIAVPASRIVSCLGTDAMGSLPRTDIDIVVTEHGAADLRAKSVHERAAALIAIASPQAHAQLQAEWTEIARHL